MCTHFFDNETLYALSIHTHTHIHIHTYIHTHIYIHTYIHTYIHNVEGYGPDDPGLG